MGQALRLHQEDQVNSLQLLSRAVRHPSWRKLSGVAQRVYIVYFAHCDKSGQAFPGLQTIADMAGMEKKSARRGRRDLEDAGFLEIIELGGVGHTSNRYQLADMKIRVVPGGTQFQEGGTQFQEGGTHDPLTRLTRLTNPPQPPTAGGEPPNSRPGRVDIFSDDESSLFAKRDAEALLIDRGLSVIEADRLIRNYGTVRCRDGVSHVDHIRTLDDKIKSYRGLLVWWLTENKPLHHQVVAQRRAVANKARQDYDAQRRHRDELREAKHSRQQRANIGRIVAGLTPDELSICRKIAIHRIKDKNIRAMEDQRETFSYPFQMSVAVVATERKELLFNIEKEVNND